MNEHPKFKYTYTSPRRPLPPAGVPADRPDRPRRAVIAAILIGLGSCLTFGLGLTCAIEWNLMFVGTLLGLIGIAGMAACPALYRRLCAREENKPRDN